MTRTGRRDPTSHRDRPLPRHGLAPWQRAWRATALVVLVGGLASPALAASMPTSDRALGSPTGYALPVGGRVTVLRGFEPPPQPWAAGHRGVDLAAVPNGDVLAPGAGIVSFAGRVAGRPLVTITHADGRRSTLEPVAPDVVRGDHVSEGEVVGTVSPHGGHCPQTCVHWGVRVGSSDPPTYVDPLALVGMADPIVLLPMP